MKNSLHHIFQNHKKFFWRGEGGEMPKGGAENPKFNPEKVLHELYYEKLENLSTRLNDYPAEELLMLQNFLTARELKVDDRLAALQVALRETMHAKEQLDTTQEAKEKRVRELLGEITKKIQNKYKGNNNRRFIVSPTGKKLAIVIDGGDIPAVYINKDSRYHYMSEKDGILSIAPTLLRQEIDEGYAARKYYLERRYGPERKVRAELYDNAVDFYFSDYGDGYGTPEDRSNFQAVFTAFGFDSHTPARDKLITILETLNNQL